MSTTLSSLGWLTIGTSTPRPAARLLFSDAGGDSPQLVTLTSIGWLGIDLPAKRQPLALRPEVSAPVGTPFSNLAGIGWNSPLQDRTASGVPIRPQPIQPHLERGLLFGGTPWDVSPLPRQASVTLRVDSSVPIGTPFAIALPSNGWLATENPRTRIVLGKSVTVDPVGNLLVLPPLPNLSWLATENPRTRLVLGRSTPTDPVGPAFPVPFALGPYWSVDLPNRKPPGARPLSDSSPIGPALANLPLSSLGWMSGEPRPVQANVSAQPLPTDAHLTALAFGGTPWAGVESIQRAPRGRPVEVSAPIGQAFAGSLASLGWLVPEAARSRLVFAQPGVVAPVGTFMPPPVLPSMGFQAAVELPPKWKFVSRPLPSEPVGTAFSTVPAAVIWPTAGASHGQRAIMIGDTRRKR
jgi:hypothetical protein